MWVVVDFFELDLLISLKVFLCVMSNEIFVIVWIGLFVVNIFWLVRKLWVSLCMEIVVSFIGVFFGVEVLELMFVFYMYCGNGFLVDFKDAWILCCEWVLV